MAIRSQLQITLSGTDSVILIDVPTRRGGKQAHLQKLAEQGRRIYCECGMAFDLTELDDGSNPSNCGTKAG